MEKWAELTGRGGARPWLHNLHCSLPDTSASLQGLLSKRSNGHKLRQPTREGEGCPEVMDEALELSQRELRGVVKQCLADVAKEGTHPSLTPEICQGLLKDAPPGPAESKPPLTSAEDEGESGDHLILVGYPDYPLCNRLSDSIAYWMITGKCPVFDLPVMFMLNEQDSIDERRGNLDAIGSQLSGSYSLWGDWSEDERLYHIMGILKELGLRGVLDLLGIRKTAGSSDLLPPSKEVLLTTFNAPHSPSATLTVGARALSKHHHRDSSVQWWGNCTGSEAAKNRNAFEVVNRVLQKATWINIHSLPHDVKVVEMRTIEGYGARWLYDGSEFRGFLEPQMEDGHQVGWKH